MFLLHESVKTRLRLPLLAFARAGVWFLLLTCTFEGVSSSSGGDNGSWASAVKFGGGGETVARG